MRAPSRYGLLVAVVLLVACRKCGRGLMPLAELELSFAIAPAAGVRNSKSVAFDGKLG